MPLKQFQLPSDRAEPTSIQFWNDMNQMITYINQLETRINALQATLTTHMSTPKAHG